MQLRMAAGAEKTDVARVVVERVVVAVMAMKVARRAAVLAGLELVAFLGLVAALFLGGGHSHVGGVSAGPAAVDVRGGAGRAATAATGHALAGWMSRAAEKAAMPAAGELLPVLTIAGGEDAAGEFAAADLAELRRQWGGHGAV